MKVKKQEGFEYTSLKDLSKFPPQKKLICLGKVIKINSNSGEIILQDHTGKNEVPLYVDNEMKEELLNINEDLIIKIFGEKKAEGLKVIKLFKRDITWDDLAKVQRHLG